MDSAIYQGRVVHQRNSPKHHQFDYELFMMYVDLDELPHLFTKHTLWNVDKPALANFKRADHYGDPKVDLATSIRQLIKESTSSNVEGPIRLLTHFRYFGYTFNPLSLYYCYDKSGTEVTHVVAEVSNTPWNERHCYVLEGESKQGTFVTKDHDKCFHVSPFMDLNMSYHWEISIPTENLSVRIENYRDNEVLFHAALDLKRHEITQKTLMQTLLNFPLMSYKVTAAIYIQALRLWLKGIKYVPYSKKR
jgi:DUF1365 family protein